MPIEVRSLFEAMQREIHALQHEVPSLKNRLGSNSRNSSKPPSTDPVHLARQPHRTPFGKQRGGQPGHHRATRPLVLPEQLADTIACKPATCVGCGHALDGSDLRPIRHQVAEVSPVRPEIIEYQLHRLTYPGCGKATRAPLPEGVPSGSFGPRLRAMLSLLAAEFRLAKRPVQRLARTMLGLDISLGMVAKLERQTAVVLGPVDEELARAVRSAPASHIDETPWREAHQKAWLWVGTGEAVTHFHIGPHQDAKTARQVLGEDRSKVVICYRFSAYGWVEQK